MAESTSPIRPARVLAIVIAETGKPIVGGWPHYLQAVALLNAFAPKALVPTIGVIATAAESTIGILLLIGFRLRWSAYAATALLIGFGTAMTIALGIKAPLDYSVFAAAGAAFLLATAQPESTRVSRTRPSRGPLPSPSPVQA